MSTPNSTTKSISQIPCPPAESNDNDDYSLYHLQQRAQWLIDNHTALGKTCIAIAGGGGHALSTLAATSGASQLLLEGTVTYDRSSFQTYVGKNLPSDKSFSYSSVDAAAMASQSALLQGMQIQSRQANNANGASPTLTALRDTVGVGSASTLKTTTQGGISKSGRPSHGNIVATRANGTQVCMNLTLNCPTQNRFQQDVFVSHMILQNLEELAKTTKTNRLQGAAASAHHQPQLNGVSPQFGESPETNPEEFEGITIQQWTATSSNLQSESDNRDDDSNENENKKCPVQSAAQRILSGREDAVLLLPKADFYFSETTTEKESDDCCSFLEPLLYPVLPDNCLIIPGSFNPPHQGHTALAQAAVGKVSTEQQPRPVVFEISIKNADKPSMDPHEVSKRVLLFRDVMKENEDLEQWGILLTSAPLFNDKVRVLRQYAPTELKQDPNFPGPPENRWGFVIGTDTMERILNPKYYDNSFEKMLDSQRSMGVDFVVGGRLDQKSKDKFITGEEVLQDMPQDIQDMFILLGEDDFRVDISSTELREKQKQKS